MNNRIGLFNNLSLFRVLKLKVKCQTTKICVETIVFGDD